MSDVIVIHPMLVHFPVVLLPAALVLEALSGTFARRDMGAAARWALWSGTLAAAFAVYTGHEAAHHVATALDAAASAAVATHHDLALAALAGASVLSIWRIAVPEWRSLRSRVAYVVLLASLVAELAVGAHLGGRLVFDEGIGVRTAAGPASADGAIAPAMAKSDVRPALPFAPAVTSASGNSLPTVDCPQ